MRIPLELEDLQQPHQEAHREEGLLRHVVVDPERLLVPLLGQLQGLLVQQAEMQGLGQLHQLSNFL